MTIAERARPHTNGQRVAPRYVFIVGLPRTGSKLMMNVLENYPGGNCRITPENFFLGRPLQPGVMQRLRHYGDLRVDANLRRLVDDMFAGKFFGRLWRRLANGSLGVTKAELLSRLLASDRSARAIYATLLEIHTEVDADTLLGDKSGPHLYHVPTLLEWFPQAKIVHTFRDPRAVLASRIVHDRTRRAERAGGRLRALFYRLADPVYSLGLLAYVTVFWLRAARLHRAYQRRYPHNYYLSRFEDLVSEPETSVRRLCAFLEIGFDRAMLHPPQIGSSFRPDGSTGFDHQTLTRWKQHLSPWMQRWLLFWAGRYLKEFGYA